MAKTDLLPGTLDMLILKALEREPAHGFGLTGRLQAMSRGLFHVEMGSLYPALCRLEARGLVRGEWGVSDANRKARYYSLCVAGRRQLRQETAHWELVARTITGMLRSS